MANDAGMPDSISQSPCRPLRGQAFISMSTSTQAGSEPPQRNCRPRAATHSLPHERVHSVEQMSATNLYSAYLIFSLSSAYLIFSLSYLQLIFSLSSAYLQLIFGFFSLSSAYLIFSFSRSSAYLIFSLSSASLRLI